MDKASTITGIVSGKRRASSAQVSAGLRERRWLSRVALACIVVLSGCIRVGPDFTRPETEVRPQWMEAGDAQVRTSPADYRMWWTAFGDPVLDTLVRIAYAQNIPLRAAGARVFEARARLGIAIGEQYPQLQQAVGSAQDIRESERDSNAPQRKSPADQFQFLQIQAGAVAAWEIDFWGKFRRAVESEDASFLSSIAAYDNALVTLTADVAQTYITIRTLEERLRISKENVELQRESLRIAQARFEAGSVAGLDVQQALAQLRSTEAVVPQLAASIRQAKNALCTLLGMPPGGIDHLIANGTVIPQAPLAVAVGIPADLLRRRPDIRSAELQAAAQSARIGVVKADLYPALTLNGSLGFLATDVGRFGLSDVSDWGSRYYSMGPSFAWNILNYGQITNNVRVQDARFQALLFAYQSTVLRAQQEVENALSGFLQSQKSLVSQAEAVTASKKAADLAMIQYRAGAIDYTTVIIAQRGLLVNQDDLANLQGTVPQALVAVYRALGGGWELREGRPLLPTAITTAMAERTDWGGLLDQAAVEPLDPRQLLTPDW